MIKRKKGKKEKMKSRKDDKSLKGNKHTTLIVTYVVPCSIYRL